MGMAGEYEELKDEPTGLTELEAPHDHRSNNCPAVRLDLCPLLDTPGMGVRLRPRHC